MVFALAMKPTRLQIGSGTRDRSLSGALGLADLAFASQLAQYFQNKLREGGLLAPATYGIGCVKEARHDARDLRGEWLSQWRFWARISRQRSSRSLRCWRS